MDFSDWFDFNNRVKQDLTLVKEVNGQVVTKQVKGSFNWLAWLFNWLYVLLTQKYKTRGFVKKALVPMVAIYIADAVVLMIFGQLIGSVFGLVSGIWYGMMFDTWFKNQLIVNGYHVDNRFQTGNNGQQNFE
ncbi:hypothetical protein [Lactiplantibacillus plantarum]|uniref:hypothetical protein n=1 Tax=Lactiplantibacillus plantarum TaxID=1590 RepID=UPI000FF8C37F|nr:hypothetical protein [Lactiplantibacillus plantarum]MBP5835414.1 hypothetical protein [Lactiplantibacillus plantarum]MBU7470379.1 hypothetical protein [Lactiplantibacillus plantarum]QAR90299.1 hypothetical protein EQJ03_13535 [Lactiplantibacillus plantarum]